MAEKKKKKSKPHMQAKGLSFITQLFKPQVYKYSRLYWPLDLDSAEHLLSALDTSQPLGWTAAHVPGETEPV